jgi:hypothetical protein
MTLRIEFTRNRSPSFLRVLEICREFKGYSETVKASGPLYSVTFKDDEVWSAEAIRDMVNDWKGTAYYIDGKLVSRLIGFRFIWDEARKEWERVKGAGRGYAFDPLAGPHSAELRCRRDLAKNIIVVDPIKK